MVQDRLCRCHAGDGDWYRGDGLFFDCWGGHFDFDRQKSPIRAANVAIEDISATGAGVKAKGVEATGDFSIKGVVAGRRDPLGKP